MISNIKIVFNTWIFILHTAWGLQPMDIIKCRVSSSQNALAGLYSSCRLFVGLCAFSLYLRTEKQTLKHWGKLPDLATEEYLSRECSPALFIIHPASSISSHIIDKHQRSISTGYGGVLLSICFTSWTVSLLLQTFLFTSFWYKLSLVSTVNFLLFFP